MEKVTKTFFLKEEVHWWEVAGVKILNVPSWCSLCYLLCMLRDLLVYNVSQVNSTANKSSVVLSGTKDRDMHKLILEFLLCGIYILKLKKTNLTVIGEPKIKMWCSHYKKLKYQRRLRCCCQYSIRVTKPSCLWCGHLSCNKSSDDCEQKLGDWRGLSHNKNSVAWSAQAGVLLSIWGNKSSVEKQSSENWNKWQGRRKGQEELLVINATLCEACYDFWTYVGLLL